MAHLESETFIGFIFCHLKRLGNINVRIWILFISSEIGPVKPHTQPVPATLLANEGWTFLHHLSLCNWFILYLYWNTHWFVLSLINSDWQVSWITCMHFLSDTHSWRKEGNEHLRLQLWVGYTSARNFSRFLQFDTISLLHLTDS